jgi:hypothetical protein
MESKVNGRVYTRIGDEDSELKKRYNGILSLTSAQDGGHPLSSISRSGRLPLMYKYTTVNLKWHYM